MFQRLRSQVQPAEASQSPPITSYAVPIKPLQMQPQCAILYVTTYKPLRILMDGKEQKLEHLALTYLYK